MENCFGPTALLREWLDPINQSLGCASILYETASAPALTLAAYLMTFAATIILETPLYWFMLRRFSTAKFRQVANAIMWGNLATHPLVVLVWPHVCESRQWNNLFYVSSAELFAPAVETVVVKYIARTTYCCAAASAIVANLFSWWLGALIF